MKTQVEILKELFYQISIPDNYRRFKFKNFRTDLITTFKSLAIEYNLSSGKSTVINFEDLFDDIDKLGIRTILAFSINIENTNRFINSDNEQYFGYIKSLGFTYVRVETQLDRDVIKYMNRYINEYDMLFNETGILKDRSIKYVLLNL